MIRTGHGTTIEYATVTSEWLRDIYIMVQRTLWILALHHGLHGDVTGALVQVMARHGTHDGRTIIGTMVIQHIVTDKGKAALKKQHLFFVGGVLLN
jgi:hypothetical protein